MPIDTLIARLNASRCMGSQEEVAEFEGALASLGTYSLVEIVPHLPALFLVFDDSSEHQDVMWGLLHLIERLDTTYLIKAFAEAAPNTSISSPEWASTILNRILNSDLERARLKELLPALPIAGQIAIRSLLNNIATQSETRRDKVVDVLTA